MLKPDPSRKKNPQIHRLRMWGGKGERSNPRPGRQLRFVELLINFETSQPTPPSSTIFLLPDPKKVVLAVQTTISEKSSYLNDKHRTMKHMLHNDLRGIGFAIKFFMSGSFLGRVIGFGVP